MRLVAGDVGVAMEEIVVLLAGFDAPHEGGIVTVGDGDLLSGEIQAGCGIWMAMPRWRAGSA